MGGAVRVVMRDPGRDVEIGGGYPFEGEITATVHAAPHPAGAAALILGDRGQVGADVVEDVRTILGAEHVVGAVRVLANLGHRDRRVLRRDCVRDLGGLVTGHRGVGRGLLTVLALGALALALAATLLTLLALRGRVRAALGGARRRRRVVGGVGDGRPTDRECGDGGIYVRVDLCLDWIRDVTGAEIARAA